jgi:hypothetical protein
VDDSYRTTGKINWGKIGLWGGIAAIVIIFIIFGIRAMNNSAGPVAPADNTAPATAQTTTSASALSDNTQIDTTVAAPTTTPPTAAATPAAADGKIRVVLGVYPSRSAAERRIKTLTSNGNTVELVAQDSSNFLVVMPIAFGTADSTRTIDSLRRMFNPKGVRILQ